MDDDQRYLTDDEIAEWCFSLTNAEAEAAFEPALQVTARKWVVALRS